MLSLNRDDNNSAAATSPVPGVITQQSPAPTLRQA